ncbi:uncharacterized protein LOC126677006 isoform X2 [Mercurialis annua]|uniref:uncharacterized protein LOC126677006 isoform X2 n=1 Tax=Mercurialis annua TaxID=3986 RepID=UPI002160F1D9|nr:uncharacterized protein LOC126677006 isoform X2 [Mercurialis annua]
MEKYNLPFKVGQLAEARSFISGYRGAWFRCKIKEIGCRKGEVGLAVEYYDFPDDKVQWTKLYQKLSKSKAKDPTLMIRPCFPPIYHEGELSNINHISEVVVILNDAWKVGDLVDWWTDGCYWSGRLIEVLGPEKFRIELLPPPAGEGSSYEASCEDFRPSLDWSPHHGWTVPESSCSCARLVKPVNPASAVNVMNCEGTKTWDDSVSSDISSTHLPPCERSKEMAKRPLTNILCTEKRSVESSPACTKMQPVQRSISCMDAQTMETKDLHCGIAGEHNYKGNVPSKKPRIDRSIMLNSMSSNTIEAAIMDLEELVIRVRWMKDILKFGMPLPDSVQPSWEFVEHRGSSTQK